MSKAAVQIWQDNPWWGGGPGHYDSLFPKYRPELVQARPVHAHNDYLNTLADWGVVGTALVASAWALLYFGAFKTWRFVRGAGGDFGNNQSNRFAFVLGASTGLLALLFHSVVDFNMHIPANAILAVSLMALLSSHLRFVTERYWLILRPWTKVAASAFLLAGTIFLAQQGWRGASEYAWLKAAARAPRFSNKQIKFLGRAFAAEPENDETAYAIGEAYRVQSLEGGEDYRDLAGKALEWFARGIKLNPHNSYNYLRYGMCLDWMGKKTESAPYFDRADQLDPNSYFTMANIGLHYVELGDYAAARPWFRRSLRLEWRDVNKIARNYLEIANRKLLEAATNEVIGARQSSGAVPRVESDF